MSNIIKKHIILKFIELALTWMILIIRSQTVLVKFGYVLLSSAAFVSSHTILVGLLLGAICGTPADRRIDAYFSTVACMLYIAVGAVYIQEPCTCISSDTERLLGFSSIITAIVFFGDAFTVVADHVSNETM